MSLRLRGGGCGASKQIMNLADVVPGRGSINDVSGRGSDVLFINDGQAVNSGGQQLDRRSKQEAKKQAKEQAKEKARITAVGAEEQAALRMTPEERGIALAAASIEQEMVAVAADAATAEEKAMEEKAYTEAGLRPLEPLLANIDLIDAAYLIALGEAGGVVPRWQDVPAAARINAASVWRLRGCYDMPILVLSYPWLDRHHPDKHGATLRRILPILRACVEKAQ